MTCKKDGQGCLLVVSCVSLVYPDMISSRPATPGHINGDVESDFVYMPLYTQLHPSSPGRSGQSCKSWHHGNGVILLGLRLAFLTPTSFETIT